INSQWYLRRMKAVGVTSLASRDVINLADCRHLGLILAPLESFQEENRAINICKSS
ncbi:hypothetical protein J6590_057786, partial [Homalodisca vitripennis]